jgi:uncharacterized membrane protein
MSKYRKLIVAALGAVIIAVDQFFGVSIGMGAEEIVNFAVPILTAIGVWGVPNEN